jgi:hypothetical protein
MFKNKWKRKYKQLRKDYNWLKSVNDEFRDRAEWRLNNLKHKNDE